MKKLFFVGVFLMFILTMSGCSTFEQLFQTSEPDYPEYASGVSDGMYKAEFWMFEDEEVQTISEEQVVHEEQQLLDPEELTPGLLLERRRKNSTYQIVVLSEAYEVDGSCMFDFAYLSTLEYDEQDPRRFYWDGYCSDAGLTPYSSGVWNRHNHLVYTGLSFTPESVELLRESLEKAP